MYSINSIRYNFYQNVIYYIIKYCTTELMVIFVIDIYIKIFLKLV